MVEFRLFGRRVIAPIVGWAPVGLGVWHSDEAPIHPVIRGRSATFVLPVGNYILHCPD